MSGTRRPAANRQPRGRAARGGPGHPSLPQLPVLHVEDNDDDALLMRLRLEQASEAAFAVHRVSTLAQALARGGEPWAAVLLDLDLPDSRGIATVQAFRSAHPNTPVVVLTGRPEADLGIASLRLGVQEYLPKDEATPHALERRLMHAMERARLQRLHPVRAPSGGLGLQPLSGERDLAMDAFVAQCARNGPVVVVSLRRPLRDLRDGALGQGVPESRLFLVEAAATGRVRQGRGLRMRVLGADSDLDDVASAVEEGCAQMGAGASVIVDSLGAVAARAGPSATQFLQALSNRLALLGFTGKVLVHPGEGTMSSWRPA